MALIISLTIARTILRDSQRSLVILWKPEYKGYKLYYPFISFNCTPILILPKWCILRHVDSISCFETIKIRISLTPIKLKTEKNNRTGIQLFQTLKNASQKQTTVMLTLTVPTPRVHSTVRVTMVTQEMESRVSVSIKF